MKKIYFLSNLAIVYGGNNGTSIEKVYPDTIENTQDSCH